MKLRLLAYVRNQHLGLIALVLVVAGGTAYAAGLAKDSVKSKQIKNGQVKSVDVKDQGLTGTDIADGSVGSPEVADGSIAAAEIQDGAVGSPEIGNDAVTPAELANDAVIGQKIATGVIGGGKLSPGAVSTNKIEDGAVDASKVADGSLGGADVADGSIGSADVADGSITQADLDPNTTAEVITKSSSTPADGTLRSALTVPGFGDLQLSCTAGPNITLNYAFESGVAQTAVLVVRNSAGAATASRVNVSPAAIGSAFNLVDGYVWVDIGTRVAHVEFTVERVGGNCEYATQATIDHDEP